MSLRISAIFVVVVVVAAACLLFGCCYSNGPCYLSLVFCVAVVLTLIYKNRVIGFDVFVSHLF